MTICEYISQKLRPFGQVSEAQLLDMAVAGGFNLDEEYSCDNAKDVGIAMIEVIAEQILMPKMSSVNEGGFSVSWNYDGLSKYYLLLCKKYGITPDADIVGEPVVYVGG